MAKQEVGLKIDVDVQSVGNMKQQLRAATQELIAMNEKFGSSSKEATEAARRVARLKDAIGDAKALADTFNPDKKFVALGGAVQGAVAGFSALQGAMGLFGSESKEVEQLLLKVQSAMALQQGISGVAGAMDAFGLLAGKIKTQVIVAFNSLRAAIGATGIGLLVVGIGLLVANFDKVKEAVMRFIPGLKTLSDFVGGLVTKLTDFVGITSEAERNLEKFTKANKKANETIDAQIKLLEAQGGKEDQIYQKKKERIENELNLLRQTLKEKGKLTDEELKQFRDLKLEQQLLDIEEANRKKKVAEEEEKTNKQKGQKQIKLDKEAAEKKAAADKVLDDARRSLLTERQRAEEDALRDFENAKLVLKKAGIDNTILIEKQYRETLKNINIKYENEEKERLKKEQEEKVKKDKEKQDADIKNKETQFASIRARAALELEIEKDKEDEKKRIAEEGSNARIMLARAVGDTLSALSDIVGRETAAGKALAIAQATINTFLGITEVWKAKSVLPEPFNTASKVAATITTAAGGFAAVRKIAQTSVPGAGGGGGGVGNLSAPVTPALAPQVVATQVNTAAVNQMGNRAARAYVLNSDIQNDNQRNAYIDRSASIG